VTPLQLAIILSVVDNASRIIHQVQEKLEGLSKVEHMISVGEGMTFAGGLIRAADDALGFADAAREAMDFQDEIARVNIVLPRTAGSILQLGEIQELAIAQSERHGYAAKEPLNALAAIAGISAASLRGSKAGTAFAEMMNAIGRDPTEKLAIPFTHAKDCALVLRATLDSLAQSVRTHTDFASVEKLTKAFGVRGARAELVQQLSKLGRAQRALNNSTGASVRMQQTAQATASERYQILKNNLEAVVERSADVALPALTRWIDGLTGAAHAAGGLLLTLGPIVIAGGYALKVVGQFGTVMKLAASVGETLVLKAMYAWEALSKGEGVMAALDALVAPWGLIIAGAVALGRAGYEVYKHWSTVKAVFFDVDRGAQTALDAVLSFVKHWEIDLLAALVAPWAMLPHEIIKHVEDIKDAAGKVANAIARFFVGHSPIPDGPLHDVNLACTIAMTLTPSSMLVLAMRTTGAIAGPFAVAGGGGRGGITVNYSPSITINGSGSAKEEFAKALQQHSRELVRIIKEHDFRERRLRFDD
jgi:hypothetical protein